MSLRIADVKLVLREGLVEGGISIRDGRIDKISKTRLLPESDKTIDGKGLIAIPGLIDAHVHLRDMELSYKEDFSSGTLAAAAGGFTTVFDMPNTKPPTNSEARLIEKTAKARTAVHVNVGFHASLAESATDLRKMVNAGAIAFKLYMNESDPDVWHNDPQRLLPSLEECGSLGIPVAVHAENGPAIARIQTKCREAGKNSIQDLMRAHAPRFELEAVQMITELARRAHSRMHVCHLSTQRSLREISAARRKGVQITCEVTPHHLLLDVTDLKRKGGFALMVPPLRKHRDTKALWRAMLRSEIDIVASDHAPHTLEEKTTKDVWSVRPGLPGLETTLPLLLTKVHRGELTLARLVQLLAEKPADIFGLQGKGRLQAGMDGDLVLIDPKARPRIDSSGFYSKARFSPFDGFRCAGQPVTTIVAGHIVYDRGEVVEKNRGKIIARGVKS
jgi:dihydroorotase (multifunctional complex type)